MARVHWRDKCPVDVPTRNTLLKEYFSAADIQSDGRVAWTVGRHHAYQLTLLGCLEFPAKMPGNLKHDILWQASNDCVKSGLVSSDALLKALNDRLSRHIAIRSMPAKILTKLSCQGLPKNSRIALPGTLIVVHRDRPGRLDVAPFEWNPRVVPSEPDHYTYLSASVQGRNICEHFEVALRGISMFIGFINFVTTYGTYTVMPPMGSGLPLGQVSCGKHFVLFDSNGVRYERRWYFVSDDDLVGPLKVIPATKFGAALQKTQTLVRRLRNHPLCDDIFDALVLYQSALEARDVDTALMRIWSALEQLVLTSERNNKDDTIRRVSCLFCEDAVAKAQLTAIVEYRNRAVHRGEHDSFGVALAERGKSFFEEVLFFYAGNKIGLRKRSDYQEFLAAPHEAAIEHKIRILQKRVRFANRHPRKGGQSRSA